MKKNIFKSIVLIALLAFTFPVIVNAKTFYPTETDLNISIDDTRWYVFTRNNIYNNSELEELGVTYEDYYNFMRNNYIYLDAALLYEDSDDNLELFIRKNKVDKIKNLSNYSNKEVKELAEEIAKKQNCNDYDIYESDYKFIHLKYKDLGFYLEEYYTIINGQSYTFTIQKQTQFTSSELREIKDIIDSIYFNVDTSLKEPTNSKFSIWQKALTGAITAAILGGISILANKKKTNKNV